MTSQEYISKETTGAQKLITINNLRHLIHTLVNLSDDRRVTMAGFFAEQDSYFAYKLSNGDSGDIQKHWCGSSACALGWATTCGDLPVLKSHFDEGTVVRPYPVLNMHRYCEHYFPACAFDTEGWHICFHPELEDGKDKAIQRLRDFTAVLRQELEDERRGSR